jgi:hypothetical protein
MPIIVRTLTRNTQPNQCISLNTVRKHTIDADGLVMDEVEAKENRPVTPSTHKSRATEVVGSGSTWGAKEREKFRIKTDDAVDVGEFIEDKWFDFGTLSRAQQEGITFRSLSTDFSNGIPSIRTHDSF